jgi:hypothetical protein
MHLPSAPSSGAAKRFCNVELREDCGQSVAEQAHPQPPMNSAVVTVMKCLQGVTIIALSPPAGKVQSELKMISGD